MNKHVTFDYSLAKKFISDDEVKSMADIAAAADRKSVV